MADFAVLAGTHQGLFLVLVLTTLIPALIAHTLVYQPTKRALARKTRLTLLFVWISLSVFAGQLLLTWAYFQSFGWLYIKDKTIGFLPLITVPVICVLFFSLPRLLDLAAKLGRCSNKPSYIVDNPDMSLIAQEVASADMSLLRQADPFYTTDHERVDEHLRKVVSAPELIVPLQVAVLGSATACYLQLTFPAVTLEPSTLLVAWVVMVAATSAL
ncbi:multicopper oxidase family protein, partial [Mesorhizobium sp. M00.F.Ca.ET.186.01.1.1]